MSLINLLRTFTLIFFLANIIIYPQLKTLDDFETSGGWKEFLSDGVTLKISNDLGLHGNAIRFDYDFTIGLSLIHI